MSTLNEFLEKALKDQPKVNEDVTEKDILNHLAWLAGGVNMAINSNKTDFLDNQKTKKRLKEIFKILKSKGAIYTGK